MRSQTRSQIVQIITKLERGDISPAMAAAELRRIINEDLADTLEQKIRA